MASNVRPAPDQVLVDIVDYVVDYRIQGEAATDCARLALMDTVACALEALDSQECMKLVEPLVPGMTMRNGARVPGTHYEMDPVTAAFGFGCMIRWLDFNDTFTAAQGSHPSDNLAGILMLADYLNREGSAGKPLLVSDVLEALIKAYEIQGCIAIENDFSNSKAAIDHPILTGVASAAVLTRMLGGTREQVFNAVTNAWMDNPLVVYRHAPNTGWRKSWASALASSQAMRYAFMALKGEMGYPTALSAKRYGLYDARFGGEPLKFQRPYGEYVIQNSMFKFVPAGMHSQSAIECAFKLHPLVKDRLDHIERIELHTQRALMNIMNKTGPLHNPADRDHCVQYIAAVVLIHGQIEARDFSDEFAADPRIDKLRDRMTVTEDARYTRDFVDPAKRSSANAMQVFFKDGSSTPRVEFEYPVGHPRRRSEVLPVLKARFAATVKRTFNHAQSEKLLAVCEDAHALDAAAADRLIDLLVPGGEDLRIENSGPAGTP